MKRNYDLHEAAEQDLRSILRYTRDRWGSAQATLYIADLEHGMASLAAGEQPYRDLGDLRHGLRMRRCRQHLIFCRIEKGQRPRIVAILHVRMDLIMRLAGRLA